MPQISQNQIQTAILEVSERSCCNYFMRILHVSTSLTGGAGIAALRTHYSLLSAGADSTLVSLSKSLSATNSSPKVEHLARIFPEKFMSFLLTRAQRSLLQNGPYLQTPLSLGVSPKRLKIDKYDLIHIHSMYNLINYSTLSRILETNIPVVITLHDQRLTTGGCHGSMSCTNYLKNCRNCPQVYRYAQPLVSKSSNRLTSLINSNFDNILLIAPSDWINEISNLRFPKVKSKLVFNCVEEKYFSTEKIKKNQNLNSRINIGFASIDIHNSYKGLRTLLQALDLLEEAKSNYRLVLLGNGDLSEKIENLEILRLGEVKGENFLRAMSEIDVLIVPSDQDNLPNVMCEALCLGVPVIGSRVGGIPFVLDKFNLPLFTAGGFKELAKILSDVDMIRSLEVKKNLAKEMFSPYVHANNLLSAYSEITSA